MSTMPRFIPDAECVQSKCANATTGCRDVCMMRNPGWVAAPLPAVPAPTEQAGLTEGCGLPALPFTARSTNADGGLYTAYDMQDYARAALAARQAPDTTRARTAALSGRQGPLPVERIVLNAILGNSHPCDGGYLMFINAQEVGTVVDQVGRAVAATLAARQVGAPDADQAKPDLSGLTNGQIDAHLDSILRASGSALRHYSLQKPIDDMRSAMRAALLATHPVAQAKPDAERDAALDAAMLACSEQAAFHKGDNKTVVACINAIVVLKSTAAIAKEQAS